MHRRAKVLLDLESSCGVRSSDSMTWSEWKRREMNLFDENETRKDRKDPPLPLTTSLHLTQFDCDLGRRGSDYATR